jgi:hypothetical protein
MAMPDFGPQQPIGCQGKVDFLFIISADSHDEEEAGAAPGELPWLHGGDRGPAS